jgi:hypothetical protein
VFRYDAQYPASPRTYLHAAFERCKVANNDKKPTFEPYANIRDGIGTKISGDKTPRHIRMHRNNFSLAGKSQNRMIPNKQRRRGNCKRAKATRLINDYEFYNCI